MGVKYDKFLNGVLIESVDTRTAEDISAEELALVQGNRKQAHLPVEEQLDMIYWDQVNSTTVFRDYVDAIKLAHPKP